ncbi:MAG: GPR endopeptidase [Clostridia bacterium]|nr:GPR endopeptidase [Clostridia bacterium]MBR3594522.1 GPR endopeptidase [Clostridia bacterium]
MKRTDLAIEATENLGAADGIMREQNSVDGIKITRISVGRESAKRIGRAEGKYITLETGDIAAGLLDTEKAASAVARELAALVGNFERALVIGLGNTEITPDALGPKTADRVLATRHLSEDIKRRTGLMGLRSVSVLSPGVLGQTGMESAEVIRAVCRTVKPDAVIAIDALAAADINRLGNTVQLSSGGISPGSGVGNRRAELSERTLGTRVIAVGIPTVADSSTFGGEGGFIVTPREIDMLIIHASELLAHAVNICLQPEIDREILLSLV